MSRGIPQDAHPQRPILSSHETDTVTAPPSAPIFPVPQRAALRRGKKLSSKRHGRSSTKQRPMTRGEKQQSMTLPGGDGPAARVQIASLWQMTGSLMDILSEWILSHGGDGADQNKVAYSTAISTHKGHLRRQAGRQASSQPGSSGTKTRAPQSLTLNRTRRWSSLLKTHI